MLTERKIVVVTRKTRLQELKEKYCTLGQAKFYLEHLGEPFDIYEQEDTQYQVVVNQALDYLKSVARVQVLERSVLPTYLFGQDDVIIVIGQDGLVANTLKYLNGQPVIPINPIPSMFEGILLPFVVKELKGILTATLNHQSKVKKVSMAEVNTNIGQQLIAVNDLFIGPKSHTSARYSLSYDDIEEEQSSSGVIVSTGLGSTGWFRSILMGASGVANQMIHPELQRGFAWNSEFLYYTVREPFPSASTGCEYVFGQISNSSDFKLTSKMSERGVIFSDGIEQDCIEFNAGVVANITISSRIGALVVDY